MAITNRDFDVAVRVRAAAPMKPFITTWDCRQSWYAKKKKLISEVIAGGSESVFPAFKVDGIEDTRIYMSKFLNIVHNGRAYSLPMQDPAASSVAYGRQRSSPEQRRNFDNCKIWCEANGAGFHLPTIAEYSFIAQEARNRGTMPRGNNSYGKDYSGTVGYV